MRKLWVMAFVFMAALIFADTSTGAPADAQRRIEEEKRQSLRPTEKQILDSEKRLAFEYGGWLNFRYDDYNEDDNDKGRLDGLKETFTADVRFWMKATLNPPVDASYKNTHSLYIRVKDRYSVDRGGDTSKHHDYDRDGPHLDYGYFVFDFRPFWIEVGRRYFSVGQGIAYSNLNDGVEVLAVLGDWNIKAFAATTLPHEHNVDVSVPGFDKKHKRNFYGTEITYLGLHDHGLYLYGVWQDDRSKEDPIDVFQNYRYESAYVGFGSQGKLLPNLHYWAEFIQEFGQSYTSGTSFQQNINASAADIGVSYDLDVYSHPNFTLEYGFGSGDPDRANVTDTLGGNAEGHDKNFLYFGYLPIGYAFSGRLSNLQFIKAGTLIKPLENIPAFRNLSTSVDVYRFYKHREKGGISDLEATKTGSDVGWELDFSASWEILSDLRTTVQYGHFFPGSVFPAGTDADETYFSVDVTYTF